MNKKDLPDCPICRGRVFTMHMLYDREDWPRSEWVYFCKSCGKLEGKPLGELLRRQRTGDLATPLH